jgi:hypothetical protein
LETKWEYSRTGHQLFVESILYSIVTEFGIPMKFVTLIKTYLNGTCSKVRISKNLSDAFPIQNSLKQGDALSPLPLTLLYNMPSERSKKKKNEEGSEMNEHNSSWSVLTVFI